MLKTAGLAFAPLLLIFALNPSANAINGAELGGYGVQNAGMGGAAIALPLDAVAAANNPAGMAFVPTSLVADLMVFRGNSTANFLVPGNALSNQQTIVAPELGFNWALRPDLTLGVTVAGEGSGSNYKQAELPVPGAGAAKSTFRITEFISTVAWKVRDDLSLGFSLRGVHEGFDAEGVIVPAPVRGGLLALPYHGTRTANGIGTTFGLLWRPTTEWSVGLNWKQRTRMGSLSGYDQDLLKYSSGKIDVPAQYGVGIAWAPTAALTVAADCLRIQWGKVAVDQDPSGFGWQNQNVARAGASWKVNEIIDIRAGFSMNHRQITSNRVPQNLLVPAINDRAITTGLGWNLSPASQMNLSYEYDPRQTLQGTGAGTGSNLTSRVQVIMAGAQYKF
jgi:long-chain fatty acid transport protein